MSEMLTPREIEQGWVIDMPLEMSEILGVEAGSMVLFYGSEGTLQTEILPPVAQGMKAIPQ